MGLDKGHILAVNTPRRNQRSHPLSREGY